MKDKGVKSRETGDKNEKNVKEESNGKETKCKEIKHEDAINTELIASNKDIPFKKVDSNKVKELIEDEQDAVVQKGVTEIELNETETIKTEDSAGTVVAINEVVIVE